jgi:serine/threonine-protein kinase RsbW
MQPDAEGRLARLVFPGETRAVRRSLARLFGGKALRRLPEDGRSTAEIVLAEVLNNVVEHAYASVSGEIEVTIGMEGRSLTFTIVDHGSTMPGEALPDGHLPEPGPDGDLPEGGFGWYMIRSLVSDIRYRRVEDRNELRFRMDLA